MCRLVVIWKKVISTDKCTIIALFHSPSRLSEAVFERENREENPNILNTLKKYSTKPGSPPHNNLPPSPPNQPPSRPPMESPRRTADNCVDLTSPTTASPLSPCQHGPNLRQNGREGRKSRHHLQTASPPISPPSCSSSSSSSSSSSAAASASASPST